MPCSQPKPRRRSTARVIPWPKDFLAADWHISEAGAALAEARRTRGPQQAMEFQKFWRYSGIAEEKLLATVAASTPGLRKRCEAQLKRLDALGAKAAALLVAVNAPPTVATVITVDFRTRKVAR
jgi:hypothetical protein